MADTTKKRHWSYLIMGIIMMGLGFYVIFNPAVATLTFAIMFIVSTLTVGITKIMDYVAHKTSVWILVLGIINLLFGIFFIFNFFVTAILIPILAGIWLLTWGIFEVIAAFGMKKLTKHWWIYLIIGILSIIIGGYMMFNWNFAVNILAWYFSIYLLVVGITEIVAFFIPDNKNA